MQHYNDLVKEYIQEQGIDKHLYNAIVDTAKVLFVLFMNADINQVPLDLHNLLEKNENYQFLSNSTTNQERLKRIFAVLDTVYLQYPISHLSLWVINQNQLINLLSCGDNILLTLDIEQTNSHLVTRCANSAWFQLINHSDDWVNCQELSCDFYKQDKMLWSFPICKPSGEVIGVLYGENKPDSVFSNEQLTWYTALTVILAEILQHLLEE